MLKNGRHSSKCNGFHSAHALIDRASVINGGVVSATLMKLYEVTVGYSKTPAGKIE